MRITSLLLGAAVLALLGGSAAAQQVVVPKGELAGPTPFGPCLPPATHARARVSEPACTHASACPRDPPRAPSRRSLCSGRVLLQLVQPRGAVAAVLDDAQSSARPLRPVGAREGEKQHNTRPAHSVLLLSAATYLACQETARVPMDASGMQPVRSVRETRLLSANEKRALQLSEQR